MKPNPFYWTKEWRRLRKEILKEDKAECQRCKEKGYYKKATHVHHVNYVEYHPELALSKYYASIDGKEKRNLISLCFDCHEKIHAKEKEVKESLTEERW